MKRLTSSLLLVVVMFALRGAAADGASPAAPVADFTLTAPVSGERFQLSEARGQFVALHFLLKTECPYCLRHTRDYRDRGATVPGVVQVFIKPDADAEIKKWASKLGDVGPTIYRDPDAALAKRLKIPGGYRFHGQTGHYPALVLLGPDGREVFRHVGKSNSDRLPFDQFAAKVAALRKSSPAAKSKP